MAKDLRLLLEDRPGQLAKVGEALGKAGVNIDGLCGVTWEGKGVIHVLVEDAVKARRALEANGLPVDREDDVIVMEVEDRPGVLGNIARRLANAGINLHLAYLATSTRLVIGADDLEKARQVLKA
ncbi:MAG: ACT domain-containing protein [Chloroflexota bacterium]